MGAFARRGFFFTVGMFFRFFIMAVFVRAF